MRPTVAFLQQQFDLWNTRCFEGLLPAVPIQLSRARTYRGQLAYKRRRKLFGGWEAYDYVLRISIRMDMPEDEVVDTLIHEMIHLYIATQRLKDSSTHGSVFRKVMQAINQQHHRHITISHHRTQEEMDADRQQRMHLVGVSTLDDGKRGITVAARSRLSALWSSMQRIPQVKETTWYVTHDAFFNRFPRALTPKVYHVTEEDIKNHLVGAQQLIRQDGRIFVKR